MSGNKYRELCGLKQGQALRFGGDNAECLLCPDMGGRIFGECGGISLHRIDLECAAHPSAAFNNYGGNNFWPAPEGGRFAFNYRGNEWYVQPAVNEQPFHIEKADRSSALIVKDAKLANRAGTILDVLMQREFRLFEEAPALLRRLPLKGFFSYSTTDSFKVKNAVSPEEALIAAWTLEQFEASDNTLSFAVVPNPGTAINFDFYEHPGEKIEYYEKGFTYRTDARRKGQIGVKVLSGAKFIGFIDRGKNLLCLRENLGPNEGKYFNIADNDQPQGHFSAADNYSIFNSDESMKAFELETVGAARIRDGVLTGSNLNSATSFAIFENITGLDGFLGRHLGRKI